MKYYFLILCSLFVSICFSQSDTEIFLFNVKQTNTTIEVENGKNISNNKGYDNQPSFMDDEKILYASTRNGQTDIAQYHLNYNSKIFINSTLGGEYTPLKIPNKNAVSAVRLDTDGKQRLYSYNLSNGESTELIENLVVAYYTWFDSNTIVAAVIEEEQLNLYTINILNGSSEKQATNVGRSFHRIPNSNLVSFIYKESEKKWQIRSLDPLTGRTRLIANTIEGVEDICWLDSKTLLSGKDGFLYKLTLKRDNNWKKITDLSSYGIQKITRLAINENASKLLIAGDINEENPNNNNDEVIIAPNETDETENPNTNEPSTSAALTETEASAIVQKHVEPFNKRNLEGFVNAFNDNIVVNRFPNDYMYSGKNTLEENYRQFFRNNKKANIKVLNRMVLKNWVIDDELVTINNKTIRQATVYEVDNEGISAMTFIRNKNTTSNPEAVVNDNNEAYNVKDIRTFAKTYSEDTKLYNYPNDLTIDGLSALRKQYDAFFNRVNDLNSEVMNRIVLGNKVIDKKKVVIDGEIIDAIAIYEVKDNLIVSVTVIQ